MIELKAFGELVRARRKSARLSQEALAAVAFGNGNRKGYISTIENGRVSGLKPETAKRLAEALGLQRHEVPASLRWPTAAETGHPQEALEAQVEALLPVVRFVEAQRRAISNRVRVQPIDAYKARFGPALDRLTRFYGESFSFRSFAMSLTLAYVYLFFAGLLAFSNTGGQIGALEIFRLPDWARPTGDALPAVFLAGLVVAMAMCGYLWCRKSVDDGASSSASGMRRLWRIRRVRILVGGIVLGCAAAAFAQLGVDPVFATIVVAIFALVALSDLGPTKCAAAGALAGTLAGLVESLVIHRDIAGGLEGAIFGGVLGGASFYVSAKVAANAPYRLIGGLSGAGAGVCAGALATMAFFAVLDGLSANHLLSSVFSVRSFEFLATQDRTFVVLTVTWTLLPLVNAGLDYLSYGVSKFLAARALKTEATLRVIALLSVVDFVVAALLSLVTIAAVFWALWVADQVFALEVAPHAFIAEWWADPFGAGIWLSLMILSTLSWSLLHYVLVVVPAASAMIASDPIFGRVKERVLRDVATPLFGFQTYALSYVPTLIFIFASVAILAISALLLWFATLGLVSGLI